ncbi:MAG: DUF1275 domain-containing protein [Clostridiales bacterium]|nr:DUF1275 domain-containing protein [Clostridiales bacterium]
MIRSKNIDWYRHLSFAAVGGFFAAYAILLRMGIMANAQTLNLLELLLSSLRCHWPEVLMHLGALAMYVLGTMSTVILPHLFGWDMRRVCPIIDALCAVLLAFLPAEMPVIPSLYPIFFAMSVQWSSFTGAQDHISSTIFSTNNTKQASLSLARHLCTREQGQIRRMWFYVSTILCFHAGATVAYFSVLLLEVKGSLCVLPLIGWAYYMVVCEDRSQETASI